MAGHIGEDIRWAVQPRWERMLMSTSISPEDRAAVLDRDQRFFEALMGADVPALENLLAEEFILVGVNDGAVVPRSALIEAVASGAVRFPTITSYHDEAIVRRLGEVAIVVGRTGMNVTGPDGAGFTLGSRYTHVFTAGIDDGWRLISAQGTPITSAP
jgi:ketosteroid isomerase-like protein